MNIRFITEDIKDLKHRVIDIVLSQEQYDQLDLGRYEKISSIRLLPNNVTVAVSDAPRYPVTSQSTD